jgi:hypothetical protein
MFAAALGTLPGVLVGVVIDRLSRHRQGQGRAKGRKGK